MIRIRKGFAYHYSNPQDSEDHHYWVVTCNPHPDCERVVSVSFSSVKEGFPIYDETTMVEKRDYPSTLTLPLSYIFYRKSKLYRKCDLQKILDSSHTSTKEPCPAKLLWRIQTGALISPNTPKKIKKFLRTHPNYPQVD